MPNCLKTARELLKRGYAVIPIKKDTKIPLVVWKEYQASLPTAETLEAWFKNKDLNIGLVTGQISGVFVLDVEKTTDLLAFGLAGHDLPLTLTVKTASGGWHYYYKLPPGLPVGNFTRLFGIHSPFVMDIRGTGGQVLIPPSEIKKRKYAWATSFADITDAPIWLIDKIKELSNWKSAEPKKYEALGEGMVGAGARNDTMTSLIGKLLRESKDWPPVLEYYWPIIFEANDRLSPPLSIKELETIFYSIEKAESRRRNPMSPRTETLSPASPQPFPIPESAHELYGKPLPPIRWVIEDIIPANAITVFSAPAGFFKTWLILSMALSAAMKLKAFNHLATDCSGILIVNEEIWEGMAQDRLKKLITRDQVENLLPITPLYFLNQQGLKLTAETVKNLIAYCQTNKIDFIVFDSLIRMHNFDENSASEIKKVFEQLIAFTKANISVLFTHHHRKKNAFVKEENAADSMRGSSDISAMVDCHISVSKTADENFLVISNPKQRFKENTAPFKIQIKSGPEGVSFTHAGAYTFDDEKNLKARQWIEPVGKFIMSHQGCVRKEIMDHFGGQFGKDVLQSVLTELENSGEIIAVGRNPIKYFLPAESVELE